MSGLIAYLRVEAGRPFVLGGADCATFAADWVLRCRGFDPLAEIRGGYDPTRPFDWRRALRAVGRTMRHAGYRLTRTPGTGDAGILVVGGAVVAAIRTERGWILRGDGGLMMLPAESVRLLVGWKVI